MSIECLVFYQLGILNFIFEEIGSKASNANQVLQKIKYNPSNLSKWIQKIVLENFGSVHHHQAITLKTITSIGSSKEQKCEVYDKLP